MTDTPSRTVLGGLRDRRQQILQDLWTDVKVLHWDDPPRDGSEPHPPIFCRYRPVGHEFISSSLERVRKASARERPSVELDSNIDLLVRAIDGVYAEVDGEKVSLRPGDPRGDLTKFDNDLAVALGLWSGNQDEAPPTVRTIVRELFLTEGDIGAHASHVIQFSDFKEAQADEELRGES